MKKILISIPDQLAVRFRVAIPRQQRSHLIAKLLETELTRQEKSLYACAAAVEKDRALRQAMQDWDVTHPDGIDDEPW